MKEKKTFIEMIKTLGVKLYNGLKRYPVSITMAAVASVLGVILIQSENIAHDTERIIVSWILALIVGVLFSLIVKTVIENNEMGQKIKWFLWIIVGLVPLFYSIYLYSYMEKAEMFEMMRFAAIVLAGFVLFMTAVFRKKTPYQSVFSTVSGWRLAITVIYTLVIWGGVSLILFAIDKLLGVYIDEKAYMDTIVLAAGIFAPMFFFSGIPKTEEELLSDKVYKFFKILVVYVIAPLLTAYTLVFYIYSLKILFTWDWPQGIVGNMVLWYAIIGTVTMYFLRAMDGEGKWAAIFGKWFPRIIILPIILLFISLVIRVNAYGMTANRYLLGAAGIWTLGCAVYLSIVNYKKRCTRIITVSLAVIALISMIGPWNAINVGRISQTNRLEKLLIENDILKNGVLSPNEDLSDKTMGEISQKVEYLIQEYNGKKVDFLPVDFEIKDMKNTFGFDYVYYHDDIAYRADKEYISLREDTLDMIIDIHGYDYIWDSDRWVQDAVETDKGDLGIEFKREENVNDLMIELDGKAVYLKDIGEYLMVIKDRWDEDGSSLTIDDLTFTDETDQLSLKFVFTGIEMRPDNRGFELGWIRFYVLVKIK